MQRAFGYTGLLFVLLAAIWGTAYVGVRAALPFVPPILLAAFRYEIGGALMLAYTVYKYERPDWLPTTPADWKKIAIQGTFVFAAFHIFLFLGQQYVVSATAAIIVATSPILSAGFTRLFSPETDFTARTLIGLVLGFLGVGIIAQPSPQRLASSQLHGAALVLLATTAFAFGSVAADTVDQDLPIQPVTAWSMFLGSIGVHAVSILAGESLAAVQWTPVAITAILFIAVVPGALGFLLYFNLIKDTSAFEINLVSYVVPITSALFGWLLLGEQVAINVFIGFIVIFVGFLCIKWHVIRTTVG